MDITVFENTLYENLYNLDCEFKRLFHGRGGLYEGFEFLTVDSIDRVLYVAFFSEIDKSLECKLLKSIKKFFDNKRWVCIVLQRRYLPKAPSEVIYGNLPESTYAHEEGLKYELNLCLNQNIGFSPDMKAGRKYIKQKAKSKKILNLFSYTCAFSVAAMAGGAKSVVNVDMAKGALTRGRKNHHLNNISTDNVQFMPYNILKSWSRIKKAGPYDMIIIDPPSFQKGSFAASKDYEKIIKNCLSLEVKSV